MTMNGLDVASYQYNNGFQPNHVQYDFMIIKVTQGTHYTFSQWSNWADQVLASGKKLGLYMFLETGNVTGQVSFFVNKIKKYLGKAVLAVDFESYNNGYGVQMATLAEAQNALTGIYAKTQVHSLLYTGLSNENAQPFSPSITNDYGAWIAQYNNYNPVYGYQPRDLYGSLKHWKEMTIFQYTSNGRLSGYSEALDFDVFYGNASDWDKLAKQGNSKPSKPDGTTEKPKPDKPTTNDVECESSKKSIEQGVFDKWLY